VLSRLPSGDSLIFAHGHVLRILAAVYLGLPPIAARHLTLDAARMGVLGSEHTWPALRVWNV
jgi:probable phosphoglycerate mutase